MADNGTLLELRKVSKRFGAVQALTDVDFSAQAGRVTALVGDNGAGKSTLIKIISGIEEVSGIRLLEETDMEQQATGVLRQLAVRIPSVRTQVASLSGGQGLAVVVISHNLADVFAVADTIVVLRLGRQVGVLDAKQTSSGEVVTAITGADADGEQPTEVTKQ